MSLSEQSCVQEVEALGLQQLNELMPQVEGWELQTDMLSKTFQFAKFNDAVIFVNRLAELSEKEKHFPELLINYNIVRVTLWTQKVNGLSENDFILAAKIDKL